jgi:hypothetical protein
MWYSEHHIHESVFHKDKYSIRHFPQGSKRCMTFSWCWSKRRKVFIIKACRKRQPQAYDPNEQSTWKTAAQTHRLQHISIMCWCDLYFSGIAINPSNMTQAQMEVLGQVICWQEKLSPRSDISSLRSYCWCCWEVLGCARVQRTLGYCTCSGRQPDLSIISKTP